METETADSRYERTKARVEALKGFSIHPAVYLIVNTSLFLIDFVTGGGWWFFWSLLGWGIAIAIHAVVLFGVGGPRGEEWQERKIRALMECERRSGTA